MKIHRNVVAAVLVLAGCATQPAYEWRHPQHADRARFDTDRAQCEYEASAATGNYSPNNRGYRTDIGRAIADQIDINSRQTQIGVLCMRARGYYQAPISQAAYQAPPVARAVVVPPPPPPGSPPPPPQAQKPAGKSFDVDKVDQLQPGISTVIDATALLGKPQAEAVISNNTKLLQWIEIVGYTSSHVSILFDANGRMIRVQQKSTVGH